MLLRTATKTKIGIAFKAIASGVMRLFKNLKRLNTKLIAIPRNAPSNKPIRALVPETLAAPQTRSMFSVNFCQIFDGGAKKYGLRLKPFTTSSQTAMNATPKTAGGKTERTKDEERELIGLQFLARDQTFRRHAMLRALR